MSDISALEKNRRYSNSYLQEIEGASIPEIVKPYIYGEKKIIDLGCGCGGLLRSLLEECPNADICGIDISENRIDSLRKEFPEKKFLCGDVCNTSLKNSSFDVLITSQVIEHVEDDFKMVDEMMRLLKKGGHLYVSSVIKKPWAIYKYRNNGKFVLDPTHEKEYKDMKEFSDLFKDMKNLVLKRTPVRRKIGTISITIPGFYIVEGLWQKK